MQPKGLLIGLVMVVALVSGCGKPPMQSVAGTVELNGKPVSNCKVGFFPDTEHFDADRHGFGFGITNEKGEFTIQHPQGEQGIYAGKYKVTLVAWVTKSGKPLPVDTKPSEVEGGVSNLFPDIYEAPSTTPEKVTVTKGENSFKFAISNSKK